MTSLALCLLAAMATYFATRRDHMTGLGLVLLVGYLYGIMRANVLQPLSHFYFDAAVGGYYLAYFTTRLSADDDRRASQVRPWLLLLIGWPVLLAVIPVHDRLVQLVGLRGAIFLVPFLLVGARLSDHQLHSLALWFAGLNIAAFAIAAIQYVVGIEPFFPRSDVTELMYRSRDVAGNTAHRIPSVFTSAHAYAATMAVTTALLIGVWIGSAARARVVLATAILASLIGVFMAAARTHMIIIGLVVVAATLSGRVRLPMRLTWLAAVFVAGFVIMSDERLQRFRTIDEAEDVTGRIGNSVNENFISLAEKYPLGVGLGGGGTSLPYFLMSRISERVLIENEYGRIMLEQGIPGLLMWLAFLAWVFTRPAPQHGASMPVTRRLTWVVSAAYWASALLGTGLLTSVPQTAVLMLYMGWLASRAPGASTREDAPYAERTRDVVAA